MRHILPSLLLLFLIASELAGQTSLPGWDAASLDKCDARTKMYLLDRALYGESSGGLLSIRDVRLFLTGDPPVLRRLVARLGGTAGGAVGRLMTASVPADMLPLLAGDRSVERIELSAPMQRFNDSARAHVGADQVIRGVPPLSGTSTGKGVIVGIIDTGIDYRHPAFRELRDPLVTRIIAMWAQSTKSGVGKPPENFGYGIEWRHDEIQLACRESPSASVEEKDFFAHGTHVAATAAGLSGMAPESEIIVVQPRRLYGGSWEDLSADIMDAALYIYETAEALGKPCVINASLGSYDHPQDGSDPLARAIDLMLAERPGRFFCAAAGNSGERKSHLWSTGGQERTVWTYAYGGSVVLRVPDTTLGRFEVVVAIDSTPGFMEAIELGRTVPRSGAALRTSGMALDTLPGGNGPVESRILRTTAASLGNGHSEIRMEIPRHGNLIARLIVRGTSPFHAWMADAIADATLRYPTDPDYVRLDSIFTTGTPAIARHVISVGSFVNRYSYESPSGTLGPSKRPEVGTISRFSSLGPATDGRIKPDLTAPGENVLSARSRDAILIDSSLLVKDDPLLLASSGTSMASPVATGAVALYLQAHPKATLDEVRAALLGHTRRDAATGSAGPLPNHVWGHGKLDIFAAMKAAGERGSWSAPIHLHDPVPNPVTGSSAYIGYTLERDAKTTIGIYDMLGRYVTGASYDLQASGYHELPVDMTGLPAGAYRIELYALDWRAIGKLLLLR